MGCGCAAGNGPVSEAGGAKLAWLTRGRLAAAGQVPSLKAVRYEPGSVTAARLLAGTNLTCSDYLALSQAQRQNRIALKYYAQRSHVGERPFNSFPTAMDALNLSERARALADVAWLNQHCVGPAIQDVVSATAPRFPAWGGPSGSHASTTPGGTGENKIPGYWQPPKAAGQVFYPTELIHDCTRWRLLTLNQKYQLAAQMVPPWRVAKVVADLNLACSSPYQYPLYPYVYTYQFAFPIYWSSSWSRHHHGGHHH